MTPVESIILDLRFRTALLESLEWDESLLQAFLLFFESEIKNNSDITYILKVIEQNFGKETHDIIVDLFKEEASNLERYIDSDTEH